MIKENAMGIVNGLLAVFKFIFTVHGAIMLTVLFVLVASIGSLNQSIKEKSITPFFKEIGGRLLNFENELYINAQKIENQGGIHIADDTLKNQFLYVYKLAIIILDFVASIWTLYTILLIFYKIGLFFSNYQPMVAAIVVVIVFVCFEITSSFVIINEDLVLTDVTPLEKHLPLRGVIKTLSIVPELINPIYENIKISGGNNGTSA